MELLLVRGLFVPAPVLASPHAEASIAVGQSVAALQVQRSPRLAGSSQDGQLSAGRPSSTPSALALETSVIAGCVTFTNRNPWRLIYLLA